MKQLGLTAHSSFKVFQPCSVFTIMQFVYIDGITSIKGVILLANLRFWNQANFIISCNQHSNSFKVLIPSKLKPVITIFL